MFWAYSRLPDKKVKATKRKMRDKAICQICYGSGKAVGLFSLPNNA
jgi:hypothetical protein